MKDFANTHINANMQKGLQTYIGKIYFYDDGFEYVANAANANIKFGKIHYSSIIEIGSYNTLGLVPNGLKIKTNDNEFNFTVSQRNAVISYLKYMNKQK